MYTTTTTSRCFSLMLKECWMMVRSQTKKTSRREMFVFFLVCVCVSLIMYAILKTCIIR